MAWAPVDRQSIGMRHLHWTLLTLLLLCMPTFGQLNPHAVLHDALVLENRGSFETAARVAKAAIDSRQLSGNELGRGYIILAVACRGAGDLANASTGKTSELAHEILGFQAQSISGHSTTSGPQLQKTD